MSTTTTSATKTATKTATTTATRTGTKTAKATATRTGTTATATGLPEWMPGAGVDAEHEPVFSQLVHDLGLVTPEPA